MCIIYTEYASFCASDLLAFYFPHIISTNIHRLSLNENEMFLISPAFTGSYENPFKAGDSFFHHFSFHNVPGFFAYYFAEFCL
jgi:hypothetical protein